MGVEYAHYLLVRDLGWFGGGDVVRRVHDVLDRRGLIGGTPELFELTGGASRKLQGGWAALNDPPPNLLVRYPHVDGGRAVADVMGPSGYDSVRDTERYFQGISLVVGTDFRIGPISEAVSVEIVRPPTRAGREVAPHAVRAHLWEFDDSYPADASTLPPETRVEARGDIPAEFTGVWRAGVMLDCGKDLPRTDGNGFGLRVGSRFRGELEAAFGTDLVEVHRLY